MHALGQRYLSLAEEVYRALFDAILTRQLQPGDRITVQQLSEELQVSSTPIKQALARLGEQGLVKHDRRKGIWVAKPSKKEAVERFELRRVFELHAVEKGFADRRVTPDFLRRLHGLFDAHRTAYQAHGTEQELAEKDRAFHSHIITLADNSQLATWYDNLNVHIHMLVYHARDAVGSERDVVAEHLAIVDAFDRIDLDGARTALVIHLERARKKLGEMLEEGQADDVG